MWRLILVFPLAACMADAGALGGGPDFIGTPPTRIDSGPMTFTVRVKKGRAQAIRSGWVPLSRLRETYVYGARAMEAASGCAVIDKTMRGDPAVMTARLDCTGDVARVRCKVDRMPGGRLEDLVAACEGPNGESVQVLR